MKEKGYLINNNQKLANLFNTYFINITDTLQLMVLQKWFQDIYMFLNPGKCYSMTFGSNTAKNGFVLEDGIFVPSIEEHVVLGITIDSQLILLFQFEAILQKGCK